MARTRKQIVDFPAFGTMVLTSRDANKDQPILLKDARRLYDEGKIAQLIGGGLHREPAFQMQYTREDIIKNREIPFSNEVKECINRAKEVMAVRKMRDWR